MLTQEMLKEGMILIGLEDAYVHGLEIIKDKEYQIEKAINNDGLLVCEGYVKWDFGAGIPNDIVNERLKYFKIKEEIKMLDPEIYAVGTTHKSVNGKNTYTIIKRDLNGPLMDYTMMVVKSSRGYCSLRNQQTGMQSDVSNPSCDLAITKKKYHKWINIYSTGSSMYTDKINADRNALFSRIACIEVEFEEGEGL